MKEYRLKKDLPTFKAGERFILTGNGLLRKSDKLMAYAAATLKKFPNIIDEWFEEIIKSPKEAANEINAILQKINNANKLTQDAGEGTPMILTLFKFALWELEEVEKRNHIPFFGGGVGLKYEVMSIMTRLQDVSNKELSNDLNKFIKQIKEEKKNVKKTC